ncbi:hypothetical protein [Georgenia wangjunii]|uniref:hypothetical protein n=1 Tax=Georgenia wangjunii TaxID=3117730 RepID=UPI002F268C7C
MDGALADLLAGPAPAPSPYRFGTITGVSPTRVRVDGDPGPMGSTPITMVHVVPGDRVLLLFSGRQMLVLAVVGGGQAREATATHEGSVWTGRFRVVRVGRGQGLLSAWFRRTATDATASTAATPFSTGLTPNLVLPAWAHITGTGVGDITLPIPAGVSGSGVNQTIHVFIDGETSVLSYRAQAAFTWTPSVFAALTVPVDIADD